MRCNMDGFIVCNVTVEGFHYWRNAPVKYGYLRNNHRHMFNIELHIPVVELNREIEFIDEQRIIKERILEEFGDSLGYAQFEGMSCEHIAEWLMNEYPTATYCKVIEDTNGGAVLVRKQHQNSFCWFR